MSFLLKQTMQSPGITLFNVSTASFSIFNSVNRLYLRTSTSSPIEIHIDFTCNMINDLQHYFGL
ncbi:hypothetical protein PUN28_007025 [Cardiocondyla obscurior]|uniref:Uncharacterized protein n=1 Tax=Cardiocondyla obscurior TaxID=286306 RepID=A0AAW2G6Z0_9HYME